jgi:endonuclease YncB( thermonuclease family)
MKKVEKKTRKHFYEKARLIIVIVLILGIIGCSSKQDEPTFNRESFPIIFNEIFLQYYEKIDTITYEEAVSLINSYYITENTTPYIDEEDGGTYGSYSIRVKDESDMHVYMSFYSNSKDLETLSLITYGNDNYEISISDNYHMSSVKYKTYAVDRNPRNIEVTELEDLIQFIFVDSKNRAEEHQKSIESLEEINVALTAEPVVDIDGKVSFIIKSNLPDNVVLMLTLKDKDSTRQTKVTLKDGTAESEKFSNNGEALVGRYKLSVTMGYPNLQDDTVTAIIGINGEFLIGDLVKKSSLGDANFIEADFEMEFTLESEPIVTSQKENNYLVTRVIDGDTIEIDFNGTLEKVRLIGVDAPESVHPDASLNAELGKIASGFTKEHLLDKEIGLEFDVSERDRYGRLLAYVWIDDMMYNEFIVENGYAKEATFPPDVKYVELFTDAQQKAREMNLGLWEYEDEQELESSNILVWLSSSGSKYHSVNNCGNMNSDRARQVTLDNAKSRYQPCDNCNS